ncbi:hypothetical protein ACLBWS_02190 [Brucellaceae bacterium D45D]
MQYEAPQVKTEAEITALLSRTDLSPDERIRIVLSALYYGETVAFSGDTLISEFMNAQYDEKRWLKNLFETFYGMCATTYRIDESIALLIEYREHCHEYRDEIDFTIGGLREYKTIFG